MVVFILTCSLVVLRVDERVAFVGEGQDSKVRMRMQEQQREAGTSVEGSFICR